MTVPIVPGGGVPAPPPPPEPSRRRSRWPISLAVIAVLVAAAGTYALTRPTSADPAASSTTSSTAAPAPTPSGSRGAEWHQFYGRESWAVHVLGVDAVGLNLIIGTDLGRDDGDIAGAICRAGKEHLARLGVSNTGQVSVYGTTNLLLAEARRGSACAPKV